MTLNLTLACDLYDRTFALQIGAVTPDGINLNYLKMGVGELFERQGRHAEFDVAEMSLSTYSILTGQGDHRMVAIPIFPSRVFRHSCIFVNTGAGIREPKDLVGKRMGCPDYQQTASVWIRGHLQHEYGVGPEQTEWFFGGMNEPEDYAPRIPVNLPADVKTNVISNQQSLDQMLERGEIDAMMSPGVPRSVIRGAPTVARLFPNYQEVEANYYRRTGIFEIMHTVVIKQTVYDDAPWVAMSMYKAFVEAKAYAMAEIKRAPGSLFCALPWLEVHLREVEELMGNDPFPYGLGEQNRMVVATLEQYAHEQGLTPRQLTVEELFAPETHATTSSL